MTTTGLSDLALPEVEFVGSEEQLQRFSALLLGTAAALVETGRGVP
ncbi:MAG: hypothetical protein SFW67_07370 [Myxococcaceae bacterium]|nr:hypothetical protein [Myxococcaceae bacterium]